MVKKECRFQAEKIQQPVQAGGRLPDLRTGRTAQSGSPRYSRAWRASEPLAT